MQSEARVLKGQVGGLQSIDFEDIRRLGRGQGYLCGQRATDRLLTETAQRVDIRPCLVDAGGETYEPGVESKTRRT